MRWWLNADHGQFSVDNAAVNGMDFSTLPENLWMVQWIDGKGEIEYQVDSVTNENGLREEFIDVTPYAPFFQQFLNKLSRLTLPQSKKVQNDLILEIYESKRQAPYHHPIAAGDYWWDATDANMFSSLIPQLQSTIAAINSIAARINALAATVNSADAGLCGQFNGQIYNTIGTLCGEIGGKVVNSGNYFIDHFNATALGTYEGSDGIGGSNTINNRLHMSSAYYARGLDPNIAHYTFQRFSYLTTAFTSVVHSPFAWSPIGDVSLSNTQWIPIGATEPVSVTPAEAAAIMQGISTRSNDLQVKKTTKIAEVNALTTIHDVIAYDVTIGW